mmetsp:Transcript_20299/g.58031  ORF Transcript_20299/g.58031 Transcript_20299/m.58031 type:complete len:303 (+) Transcript_20299:983-1891(+)
MGCPCRFFQAMRKRRPGMQPFDRAFSTLFLGTIKSGMWLCSGTHTMAYRLSLICGPSHTGPDTPRTELPGPPTPPHAPYGPRRFLLPLSTPTPFSLSSSTMADSCLTAGGAIIISVSVSSFLTSTLTHGCGWCRAAPLTAICSCTDSGEGSGASLVTSDLTGGGGWSISIMVSCGCCEGELVSAMAVAWLTTSLSLASSMTASPSSMSSPAEASTSCPRVDRLDGGNLSLSLSVWCVGDSLWSIIAIRWCSILSVMVDRRLLRRRPSASTINESLDALARLLSPLSSLSGRPRGLYARRRPS